MSLFPFVFSRLRIPCKQCPGKDLSPLVIITGSITWSRRAWHQSELPSGRDGRAEPGSSEPRIWCDCNAISGIYASPGTHECTEGRRADFIGMSICFTFYHTWRFSELISSTKSGAVVIYVDRGLPIVGSHNPRGQAGAWPVACPSVLGLAAKPPTFGWCVRQMCSGFQKRCESSLRPGFPGKCSFGCVFW